MEEPMPQATISYSNFSSVKSNTPDKKTQEWDDFAASLKTPVIVDSKDKATLFVPATFNGKRSKENVIEVFMAILDMDEGHDPLDFRDAWKARGLEFVMYSTFSNTSDHPKWRAIFPFSKPVSKDDWEAVWTGVAEDLSHGLTDRACKDASRMYFYPAAAKREDYLFGHYKGEWLDPDVYLERAVKRDHLQQKEQSAKVAHRIGDVYDESSVTIDDIITPFGWRKANRKTGGMDVWIRPGKEGNDQISATWGNRPGLGDRFYVFSSSVHNLPINQALTKFSIYAHLNHNADFKKAAKALEPQYGLKLVKQGEYQSPTKEKDQNNPEDPDKANAFTDSMNGVRLVKMFGDSFRYVVQSKMCTTWNGHKWAIDELGDSKVREFARLAAKAFQAESVKEPDEIRAKKQFAFGLASHNTGRIDNTVKEARSLAAVSILDFDNHPMLLNCRNGVLDLETGKLHPHDRKLLLSQVTGCGIAPEDAPGPKHFVDFMAKVIPDEETRKFVFQFLGYTLTGLVNETCYAFLFGSTGNNGKSTLINIIQHIMGDYGMTINTPTLMETKGFGSNPEYELARLRGKRFVVANEVSDDQRLNEALVKQITGDDTVRGRHISQSPFEFPCLAKIYMTGNSKPTIYGQDSAIWRRVNLIPFEVEVPKEERDPHLKNKLIAEAPLILRFLANWCLRWQTTRLERSPLMLQAKIDYMNESDFMGTYIEEELVFGTYEEIGCTSLHQHYLRWAKDNGSMTMNPNKFGRIMTKRFPKNVERKKSNGIMTWVGVNKKEHKIGSIPENQGAFRDDS